MRCTCYGLTDLPDCVDSLSELLLNNVDCRPVKDWAGRKICQESQKTSDHIMR